MDDRYFRLPVLSILIRVRTFLLALALLAGADWLACRFLSHRVHAVFDNWVAVLREQGWKVRSGPITEAGMPFGATLTVPDFVLQGGRAMVPGGVDLRSERIVLSLGLFDPYRLRVAPEGEQDVRLASLPPIALDADTLSAKVKLWHRSGDTIDIDAVALAGGLQNSPRHQEVRVDRAHLRISAARGEVGRTMGRIEVELHGLELPDDGRWPLGATITSLGTDIAVASPALSGADAADQARAWRDWGGAVTLERLDIKWGPLTLATAAHLGLDDHLQPAGGGTATVSGWAQSLDALANAGSITHGVAQTAKAVLGILAAPGHNGDTLVLPFTLRDSTLSVAKVPLMKINTIAWGGA